jgi:hypothetical protein
VLDCLVLFFSSTEYQAKSLNNHSKGVKEIKPLLLPIRKSEAGLENNVTANSSEKTTSVLGITYNNGI